MSWAIGGWYKIRPGLKEICRETPLHGRRGTRKAGNYLWILQSLRCAGCIRDEGQSRRGWQGWAVGNRQANGQGSGDIRPDVQVGEGLV